MRCCVVEVYITRDIAAPLNGDARRYDRKFLQPTTTEASMKPSADRDGRVLSCTRDVLVVLSAVVLGLSITSTPLHAQLAGKSGARSVAPRPSTAPQKPGEQRILFDDLGMKLVSTVDAMTDKASCSLFVEEDFVYVAIYSRNDLAVWSQDDSKILFASDASHLIRIGKDVPMELVVEAKRNGLKPKTPTAAGAIVLALARREPVRLRFVQWPGHEPQDVEIKNPNVAFVYAIGAKECGWKPLGVPSDLAPVTLDVHEGNGSAQAGYARVSPVGNRKLGLGKGFDRYGGGCHISIGSQDTLGMKDGEWNSSFVDALAKTSAGVATKLVVRDAAGEKVFDEQPPTSYGRDTIGGTPWPPAEKAARVAWQHSPSGRLALEGGLGGGLIDRSASLYGFRELWTWGQEHGCWPAVAEEAAPVATPAQ